MADSKGGKLVMKRLRIIGLLIAVATLLVSCTSEEAATGGSGGGSGETIVISGSTSVQPFIEVLAAEFEKDYGGGSVDVHGGGSTAGVNNARDRISDIGMSSRGLRGEELVLNQVIIALDGLALIVHPNNPINSLSLKQIRDIYTREITDWSELDETGQKSGAIHVVTREEGSGTRGAFEELVMEERVSIPAPLCDYCVLCEAHLSHTERRNHNIHARTIVLNTNGAIRQFVAGNPHAIGYISLGTVDIPGLDPVKGVQIDGVTPSPENVFKFQETEGTEGYGLFRPFIFIIGEDPTAETQSFIRFVLSNDGQAKLREYGLVTSPQAIGEPYWRLGGV
jgi:phosphate transport system substrate-binding protein